MSKQDNKILNGTCVIVSNAQNEILLGKRINCFRAGTYGLPGGRLEVNETIKDSARRELNEETGLEPKKIIFLGTVRENCDGYDFIHFVYSCNEFIGQPKTVEPDKCASWQWYDLEDLPELLPGHKLALKLIDSQEKLIDANMN